MGKTGKKAAKIANSGSNPCGARLTPGQKPLRLPRAQSGMFWRRCQGNWRPRFQSSSPSVNKTHPLFHLFYLLYFGSTTCQSNKEGFFVTICLSFHTHQRLFENRALFISQKEAYILPPERKHGKLSCTKHCAH